MIPDGALVLFKSKPAITRRDGDRIELTFGNGGTARVRDKDVELVHEGPLKSIPAIASGGEFETAWEMTAGSEIGLGELAELAFGTSGPGERLACRLAAAEGLLFRMDGEKLSALSAEEREAESEKRKRKESEASERAAFIERAKRNAVEPGDERFWGEVEALALGRTQKSRTASDIGAGDGPESAQAWLLCSGLWTNRTNPHPARSGHPSKAPELELGPDDDEGRVDLTGMESWAIDNAWSHDPDDAISWDGTSAWVHVADPASAIVPGCPVDIEASNRSGTLYLPEGSIPMLPDSALDRFGLGLAETSRALSFRLSMDADGLAGDVEVVPSLVRVTRTSYGQAESLLASGPLAELARVAAIRKAYRQRHPGSQGLGRRRRAAYRPGTAIRLERRRARDDGARRRVPGPLGLRPRPPVPVLQPGGSALARRHAGGPGGRVRQEAPHESRHGRRPAPCAPGAGSDDVRPGYEPAPPLRRPARAPAGAGDPRRGGRPGRLPAAAR
ncbi:MAG: hypothetical protein CVV51_14450 [Spirochaetae bacterium HGW-Spirochaetae-7]|nr:MAG: hypothetical protein CVV51_14450 [Spirochaetae bacterium HGW-Spirochaetae-7]